MEQLGLEPPPEWHATAACRGLAGYTTVPPPHVFVVFSTHAGAEAADRKFSGLVQGHTADNLNSANDCAVLFMPPVPTGCSHDLGQEPGSSVHLAVDASSLVMVKILKSWVWTVSCVR